MSISVRIPRIGSIETAILLYYSRMELSNADIRSLFVSNDGGQIGASTICKLKDKAREQMTEDHTPIWNARYINTEAAYKAWGLNISDLEQRHKKLTSLIKKKET